MIRYVNGDLFASDAQCLINPVNCEGVMGAGLAKSFRERFPDLMRPYVRVCKEGLLRPGKLQIVEFDRRSGRAMKGGDMAIINFPTKDKWREESQIEWIEEGIVKLAHVIETRGFRSVAIPKLGAGLGGLEWAEVRARIESGLEAAGAKGVDILVFGEAPEKARDVDVLEFKGENAWASNMYRAPVLWGEQITPPRLYDCNEVPYVLAKTLDSSARARIMDIYARAEEAKPGSGSYAVKKAGRDVPLRPDWDMVKLDVMRSLVEDKFRRNPELAQRLLATGKGHIQEGNTWGDTFWGVSIVDMPNRNIKVGEGRNNLGLIVTGVRDMLVSEKAAGSIKAPEAAPAGAEAVTEVINMKSLRRRRGDPMPAGVIDISRYGDLKFSDGTSLGNPYVIGKDGDRHEVIRKYARDLDGWLQKDGFADWLADKLAGKKLACFCAPEACHGDVLKAAADAHRRGESARDAIKPFLSPEYGRDAFGLPLLPEAGRAEMSATDRKTLAPESLFYAGIGSRKTPPDVEARMEDIGAKMARAGMILRSGAAESADSSFERGCDAAGGKKEIFLPWPGFNGRKSEFVGVTDEMIALAKKYHPAWDKLGQGGEKLQARNGPQMLGWDLKTPSRAVVCWTPKGEITGGTGQALRIAADLGVPVINLGSERWRTASNDEVVKAALEASASEIPVVSRSRSTFDRGRGSGYRKTAASRAAQGTNNLPPETPAEAPNEEKRRVNMNRFRVRKDAEAER